MNPSVLIDILRSLGLKKALALCLEEAHVIGKESTGQVVLHINNGGITSISYDKWKLTSIIE